MDKFTPMGTDSTVTSVDTAVFLDVDSLAQKEIVTAVPDETLLRLHRYLWTPARYADPCWLKLLGFTPSPEWRYGADPALDRCLNRALQARRGTPPLPFLLSPRQKRTVQLASRLPLFALAMGLLVLGSNDCFLLPDHRRVLLRVFDDRVIWQLFGLCGANRSVRLSPEQTRETALQLGTSVLTRAAQHDPVLHALLVTLAPCGRALWPQVPASAMNLLEKIICTDSR